MMKKVLYGVALALLACVSFGTLQSCKDDVSDLRTQTYYDLEALKKSLLEAQNALKAEITNNRNSITQIWTALQGYATIDYVNNKLAELEGSLNRKLDGEIDIINGQIGALESNLGNAYTTLAGEIRTANGRITALEYKDAELLRQILGAIQRISALEIKTNSHDTSIANLERIFSNLNTEVSNLRTILGNKVDKAEFDELKGRVDADSAAITTMQSVLDTVGNAIDKIKERLDNINSCSCSGGTTLPDVGQQISDSLKNIKDTLNVLRSDINTVNVTLGDHTESIRILGSDLSDLTDEVGNLTVSVSTVRNQLASVNSELEDVKRDVALYRQQIYELQRDVREILDEINNIYDQINATNAELDKTNTELDKTNTELDKTNTALGVTNGKVSALVSKVNDLEAKLKAIKDLSGRIDSLITGILVQAADSPVFGNFSLPLGVKSTLLFNWYGFKSTELESFPSNKNWFEADDHDPEINFEGIAEETIQDGFMADVDFGSLYLTVNPINHNFENTEFFLETSKGREGRLPFGLTLEKSNDELTFGYSRATNVDNGFYKARVHITDKNDQNALNAGIAATEVKINDNLKTAVKNALHDRTKRNAIELLKAVYGQLSGMLPAYAVRYDWTVDNQPYSVLSNYDLAIATAKPLSYNSLNSVKPSKRLPKIGRIENFIKEFKGKFNFKFDSIKFDNIKITLPEMNIQWDNVVIEDGKKKVQVIIDPIKVEGIVKDTEMKVEAESVRDTITVNLDDIINDLTGQINSSISGITKDIEGWTSSANDSITKNLKSQLDPIANQINGMMNSINGQIDDMVDDVANKFDPWFKRLNRVVDLYNRFANKVNEVLENPAHYVQVAMFYNQANSNIGMLSNDKTDPTIFNAGKGNLGLYASSYTGEIVVPAFKKFVAVSHVYTYDVKTKKVGDNAPNEKALRDAVNKANLFNKVVDGCTIRYAIPSTSLKSGYVYEIVYQGLDYHGYTSTQKFYITVK